MANATNIIPLQTQGTEHKHKKDRKGIFEQMNNLYIFAVEFVRRQLCGND